MEGRELERTPALYEQAVVVMELLMNHKRVGAADHECKEASATNQGRKVDQ